LAAPESFLPCALTAFGKHASRLLNEREGAEPLLEDSAIGIKGVP
jgi:hypothetical protein